MNKLIEFIFKHPKTCIGFSLLLIALLIPGLQYYKVETNVRIWFRETDKNIKILDQYEKQFGNDENSLIIVHDPQGIFRSETIRAIDEITEDMWTVHQIIRVDSITNYNFIEADGDEILIDRMVPNLNASQSELNLIKEKAVNDKFIAGNLINKKGTVAVIYAQLISTMEIIPNYLKISAQTHALTKKYKEKYPHLSFYVSGNTEINQSFSNTSRNDVKKFLPLLVIFIIICMYYIFRSFTISLLPLFLTFSALGMTLGTAFYLGMTFNSVLSILPAILVAISIADSIHVIVAYFRYKAEGELNSIAAKHALSSNFKAILLTTVSTIIGFLSLSTTELLPIRSLAHLSAYGTFLAFFLTIFLLAPFLSIVNFKVPSIMTTKKESKNNFFDRFALLIFVHKNKICLFGLIFSLICIAGGIQTKIDSNPYKYFTDNLPISKSNKFLLENLGGGPGPALLIDSLSTDGIKDPEFLKKVDAFDSWLKSKNYINSTAVITHNIKKLNQALHAGNIEFYKIPENRKTIAELLFLYSMGLPQGMDITKNISIDKRYLNLRIFWNIQSSSIWNDEVNKINQKAEEMGLNLKVTGKPDLFNRMIEYVVETFVKSIGLALCLVGILMALIFKDIKIAMLSFIPNVLPLLVGGLTMYLLGIDLNIGTSLVASVTLGIAVDDTIHFLTKYLENKKKELPPLENLRNIFSTTGRALIITTIILSFGFGLNTMGDFVPNKHFGILCAVILSTALIMDLIVLPAVLFVFDGKKATKK